MRTKRLAAGLALLAFAAAVGQADTIVQTNAEGDRIVVQQNAIVTQQTRYTITYKHFDLKQRRVVKVQLNQGSLPFQCVTASPAQRQGIVNVWKEFGYTAIVTMQSGKQTQVYDSYLDFFPASSSGSFLEVVPPRTNVPILTDNGAADEIDFSEINEIDNAGGGRLRVVRTNGQTARGKFLMPTSEPAVTHFMGITEHYSPASDEVYDFSVPLSQIKQIRFVSNN
jgi:hypothetical protein